MKTGIVGGRQARKAPPPLLQQNSLCSKISNTSEKEEPLSHHYQQLLPGHQQQRISENQQQPLLCRFHPYDVISDNSTSQQSLDLSQNRNGPTCRQLKSSLNQDFRVPAEIRCVVQTKSGPLTNIQLQDRTNRGAPIAVLPLREVTRQRQLAGARAPWVANGKGGVRRNTSCNVGAGHLGPLAHSRAMEEGIRQQALEENPIAFHPLSELRSSAERRSVLLGLLGPVSGSIESPDAMGSCSPAPLSFQNKQLCSLSSRKLPGTKFILDFVNLG